MNVHQRFVEFVRGGNVKFSVEHDFLPGGQQRASEQNGQHQHRKSASARKHAGPGVVDKKCLVLRRNVWRQVPLRLLEYWRCPCSWSEVRWPPPKGGSPESDFRSMSEALSNAPPKVPRHRQSRCLYRHYPFVEETTYP